MKPKVSIIIPCRNEVRFIASCLDSILKTNYPSSLIEILVIDGESNDGTLEILKEYQRDHGIKIISNPKRIIPSALNLGVSHASGEIVIRMDAHTTYDKNYISNCVDALIMHPEVKIVGGIWITKSLRESWISKAIQYAFSHPFGVGNAYYRIGLKNKRYVDVVSYFCCWKKLFDEVGNFNELIERSEDVDFNRRVLKKFGDKSILVVPEIKCFYSVPETLLALAKKFYLNGYWAVSPMQKVGYLSVSIRHLIPLSFFILILILISLIFFLGYKPLIILILIYLFFDLAFSFSIAHESLYIFFYVLFVFPLMHITYGFGSFVALVKLFTPQNIKKIYFLRKKIRSVS